MQIRSTPLRFRRQCRKPVKARQAYVEPQVSDEETISESPVTRAPLPRAKTTPQYDYTENYKKSYKQPAATPAKPKFNAPSYDDTDYAQGETEITPRKRDSGKPPGRKAAQACGCRSG